MNGPTIQDDLYSISVRFRCKKYAVTADISKMYRQIWVDSKDWKYLGILWRESPLDPVKAYVLKTVTYGTTSAPYQATRCLVKLADEYSFKYPLGAQVIKHSMYVDDLLTSTDSLSELYAVKHQVEAILQRGKFELKKWSSNCARFLETIPMENREPLRDFNNCKVLKTLGTIWDPLMDNFHFNWTSATSSSRITKRIVLSELSKLFDPLGLVNPVIVIAKIFMQRLWSLKLAWDESLPLDLHTQWEVVRNQVKTINQIKIPRYIFCESSYEFHGFADASQLAYGCCVYVRCNIDNNIRVNLVTSKSRVAPLKSLTLPRLELCAALLLAQLIHRISNIVHDKVNVTLWTDSEIVLHWINGEPTSWSTFVANRVSQIQGLTSSDSWRHVDSRNNPADIISRGATVKELVESIWYSGPNFLQKSREHWPQSAKFQSWLQDIPETRRVKTALISRTTSFGTDLIRNCAYINNYLKVCRVFALILRFFKGCSSRQKQQVSSNNLKSISIVQPAELEEALARIVFNIQQISFAAEIQALQAQKPLSPKSVIKSLCPFLDDHSPQLLRVGGRLQNADIPYKVKFPLLLPKHPFTMSYLFHLHLKLFHAGIHALVAASREQFWIINVKRLATQVVHKCVHCARYRPKLFQQVMGNLPVHRIQPARPFTNSGVDFCGPVMTTLKTRGHRLIKSYIAVFICFATKAVHLEVVSELSTDAFIGALKRFIARRGICQSLYCDNATNFVGARSKLSELHKLLYSEDSSTKLFKVCSNEHINFRFIPPRSPHFGGLWEAAVKVAKHHLYRTLHNSTLTFEELSTVTAQIEAIMNSRPISAMSSDPNDEQALTPGHFLIGGPLCAIPEPRIDHQNISHLKRWQYISYLHQHFWQRWAKEHVLVLQQRYKWSSSSPEIKKGMLVLIADDQQPPQKWLLGRIVDTIPGPDGHIRVVDVKTKNTIIRRAIHRLAPLPVEDDVEGIEESLQGGRHV